ncbi:leucine-rich_repeat domain-containing protein [Hexamita inflata]|uniref:Leucine-rich repeat domain-containing protein n=1 Tax=Hexamita inflata TaxID=28002 RepID=A0AA86RLC9_9EUKA|nr:leucine-rich repeat domain-containing protein [Hexamita inflata]CAI9975753.1 leucine-rich repeat domain-containing protein [Hexamita inflata]
MTEQNQNVINYQQDEYMTHKYEHKILYGNLQIGDWRNGDPEVTNLRFIEKLNINTLKLYISNDMSIKFQSQTIKELTSKNIDNQLNLKVDNLELENLEVLELVNNNLNNDKLYNLAKFKKLHTLDVSYNSVDLTHIHSVTNLIKLSMHNCNLQNIDQTTSLVNLEDLDISANIGIDLNPLCKIKRLIKLSMRQCGLKYIDQIVQLTNLQFLDISSNELQNIDSMRQLVNLKELSISNNKDIEISPLKSLVGLLKLDLSCCGLGQLNALKPLINLQFLDLQRNSNINITELQYLKNLTHLYLVGCNVVSIYILRPLINLEELILANNKIVDLDSHLNEMIQLKQLDVQFNQISDFSLLEKHTNFNNFIEYDRRMFSCQANPSKQQHHLAIMMRLIERTNIQLKYNQNNCKITLKTTLNNFKKEINSIINNAYQNHIRVTSSAACLFEMLNLALSQ